MKQVSRQVVMARGLAFWFLTLIFCGSVIWALDPTGKESHAENRALAEGSMNDVGTSEAIFAAGCFWGVEAAFRQLDGVVATEVGYTGGKTKNPSYGQVCSGQTGHAEAIKITYDPDQLSYEKLLAVFWDSHDPTTLDRQGPDIGSQYRSAIFYGSKSQKTAAEVSIEQQVASGRHAGPIVTQIVPAGTFFPAEEYHQQYLEKRGQAACSVGLGDAKADATGE